MVDRHRWTWEEPKTERPGFRVGHGLFAEKKRKRHTRLNKHLPKKAGALSSNRSNSLAYPADDSYRLQGAFRLVPILRKRCRCCTVMPTRPTAAVNAPKLPETTAWMAPSASSSHCARPFSTPRRTLFRWKPGAVWVAIERPPAVAVAKNTPGGPAVLSVSEL